MTECTTARAARADPLFADFPHTAEDHFRIYFFGAVLAFIERVASCLDSFEKAMERFPFLASYNNELAQRLEGMSLLEAMARWCSALEAWEQGASVRLPLRSLREAAGLTHAELFYLFTIGLVEEDARFGAAFESLQGSPGSRRPTSGFLRVFHGTSNGVGPMATVLPKLRELGIVQVSNPDAPRPDWVVQIPSVIWDAMRDGGRGTSYDWLLYRPPSELLPAEDLFVPPELRVALGRLPQLVESGSVRAIVLRGPRHNGRRTILGAVARATGRGVLEVRGVEKPDDERWRAMGTLALLRHALPVAVFEAGPGDTIALPNLKPACVPLGVVLGQQGGLSGVLADQAVTLTLSMPDIQSRQRHWQRCVASSEQGSVDEISGRFRLTAGHIHRAAQLAHIQARLADREQIELADVQAAARALNRQALDTLARRVDATGDWGQLCVGDRTYRELEHFERRCRHRERLPPALNGTPGSLSCGVRALFTGPSGTGKTLAARLVAARLQKDLYQLDISSVVNKYIGETEKNLNRIFEHAEELDVMLLLDEGDALLTRRTDVNNANDRYANLETNFLLQRLESYQGILIVTTNARNRIDAGFERRMDVVVEFSLPSPEERWRLWAVHLPSIREVDDSFLSEVASRCEFTGGQIRNAVLHASLLALDNGGVVTNAGLEAAVRREYLKQGAVCPLRSPSPVVS